MVFSVFYSRQSFIQISLLFQSLRYYVVDFPLKHENQDRDSFNWLKLDIDIERKKRQKFLILKSISFKKGAKKTVVARNLQKLSHFKM